MRDRSLLAISALAGLFTGSGIALWQRPAGIARPPLAPVQPNVTPAAQDTPSQISPSTITPDSPEIRNAPWKNYEAASGYALSLPEGHDRKKAIEKVSDAVQTDLALSIRWIQKVIETQGITKGLEAPVTRWGNDRPEEALQFFAGFPPSPLREDYERTVIKQWTRNHFSAALAYAKAQKFSATELVDAVYSIAHLLPAATVLPQIAREPAAYPRSSLLRALGTNTPLTEAKTLAGQLPDATSRETFLSGSILNLSIQKPVEALREIARISEPGLRKSSVRSMVEMWTRRAPAEVHTWLVQQPEGDIKQTAAANYVQEVARDNPDAAIRLLQTLPQGTSRNKAIETFTQEIAPYQPETARLWTEKMTPDIPP